MSDGVMTSQERAAAIADRYIARDGAELAKDAADDGRAEARAVAKLTGRSAYKIRRQNGQIELTPRHRMLATLMAIGGDHAWIRRLGFPINEPLTLEQAAAVVDIRRRNARESQRSLNSKRCCWSSSPRFGGNVVMALFV